ncbi:MAG: hypothetical protein NTY35_09220 [Planctomycetota bacterium]|nr:hypothetical protein [Planctomycetota bacterium]
MRWSTILVVLIAPAVPAAAQVCTVERISVDANGGEGDGFSTQPAITPDGRFVVFVSTSTNLVPGDTNSVGDVFVRDLLAGTIERASVGPGGVESDAACSYPAISDDGRYVAFNTAASTFDPGDTNGALDVYLRDRWSGTIERVSFGTGGAPGDGPSFAPTLADGAHFVLFVSWAGNLVPGDTNATRDVFLRDRVSGVTERVSVSSAGAEGDDMSGSSTLLSFATPDGRFVVFGSLASTLAAGDANSGADVFLRDRAAGTTTLLVQAPGGGSPNGQTELGSMTRDGRFVGFASSAAGLVAGDTNGTTDSFVLDRSNGTIERVSIPNVGGESAGDSWAPSISQDGRFAVFASSAADIVAGDTNDRRDVFRRDRLAATTERYVLAGGFAQPLDDVFSAAPTASGDRVAFAYAGDDMVVADFNAASDVFVSNCTTGRPFCSGDGTSAACPCQNVGAWNAGCPNSAGSGAILSGEGRALVANDTLALLVRELPPHTVVLFLQGSSQQSGGMGATFGDGLRCVAGSIVRLGTRVAPAGSSTWGFGAPGSPLLSLQSNVPSGGAVRLYQAWYRNAAAFCTASTFNLSNGLEVTWLP